MSILSGLGQFFKDLFTGPDGKTYNLGKVMAVPTMGVGLSIPLVAIYQGQTISMIDAGALLTGTAGAFLLLVRGAKNVDIPGDDPLLRTIVQSAPRPPQASPYYPPYEGETYGYPPQEQSPYERPSGYPPGSSSP